MVRYLFAAVVALCAVLPGMAVAEGRAVHVVIFVDLIPSEQEAGSVMLVGYVRQMRQDAALQSVALIEETRISNHYILEETFVSEAAYRRFVEQSYVRDFHNGIYPLLGSPWDERLGTVVTP